MPTTTTSSKRESSNSRRLILLLLTSGFFITGLLFDYMPMIVDNQIKRTVELATSDEIQSLWSRPPVDFHSYYWLYDIINAEKFMTGEEKVRVRRVGPYHFTSRVEKKILDVSQNKFRITYNSTRHIHLDESSSANLDEPLVLLNPVFASLVTGAREMIRDQDAQTKQMMLSSVARMAERFNESLFMNSTARVALLGRRLLIVEKLIKMAETFGFEVELPTVARTKQFGYVSVMNGTWDGPFEMYTGYQASMNSLGDIISYQGRKRLTEFQGKCNRLQASAGELRPMPVHENQTLEMFQPRFCRIIHLIPTGTRKLKEGLAISYELAADDFMSAQTNPDNRCFCSNKTLNSYCSLNGALEVGPCSYHSPVVVTASNIKPDERITGSVLNWDPDMLRGDMDLVPKSDDRNQILVLKRLGLPVQGDITLTLFMRITRDTTFRQTSQLSEESFVPILTVRERGVLPPKLGQIIVNLESFLSLTSHLKVVMYLTAIVLLCSLTGHYYTRSSGGPRITPSGDGDDDRTSQQSARNGKRNSNARSLRGSRAVALPASGAPSDRANSADSSRSQPPSRVSHSSLDAVSGYDQAGDSSADGPQRQASGSSDQLVLDSPTSPDQPGRQVRAKTAKSSGQQQHRMFSKVDEEAGLQSRAKRGADSQQKRPTDSSATNGLADSPSSSASSSSSPSSGRRGQLAGPPNGGASGPSEEAAAAAAAAHGHDGKRRNWFMKVCSNFVRMLNGIRSSINDAGQLDINENDYQDKQLEMLAGKIDSWYQSSPLTPDLSAAGSGLDGGEQAAQSISGGSEPKITAEPAQESAAANSRGPPGEQQQLQQRPSGAESRAAAAKTRRDENGGPKQPEEKSEIDEGTAERRMNKETEKAGIEKVEEEKEDDAGIGSIEGEQAVPRSHQSVTGESGSIPAAQPTTTVNAGPPVKAASRVVAAGPQASLVPTKAAPAPTNTVRPTTSGDVSVATTTAAATNRVSDESSEEPKNSINSSGGSGSKRSEERQVVSQLTPPSTEREKDDERRRDSIQSNETVINKRSTDDDDDDGGDSRRRKAAHVVVLVDGDHDHDQEESKPNSSMRDASPTGDGGQRKPPPLALAAKVDTTAAAAKSAASSLVVAPASAAGESNNELAARDKKAALASVEKALTSAATPPTNRIEGY